MNKLNLTLIGAIVVIVVIAGGYAAYTGTMGSNSVQIQAQNNSCNAENCIENQNCQKLNCTGNCTADENRKHQRNRNCVLNK